MSVVWEDPPGTGPRPVGFGREKSPLRKEVDAMVEQLQENPGKWARLYDFADKVEARKRTGFMARKGLSLFVRTNGAGWSVYGRWNVPEDESAGEDESPEATEEERQERPPTF